MTSAPGSGVDEERLTALLDQMTTEEKASLTGGADMWNLPAVPRLDLPALKMSDGPSGVRGARMGTHRSLAFPCGLAVGATWDTELVGRYGAAVAAEAVSKGVHLVLGPTVNIVRTPLAGRTFECFSEDPRLTTELAVAYIVGVQAQGVGCCIKHYAANDQEHERMTISAEVDERTLREVHLPAFEAAVGRAGVWAVMSAYNRVNGTWCGEHPWLLGDVLKGEWGFDGVVVSDWFGTHSTIEAATAGLDVEMPGPPAHLGRALAAAVTAGEVPATVLDDQARRVLRLISRVGLLDRSSSGEAAADDPSAVPLSGAEAARRDRHRTAGTTGTTGTDDEAEEHDVGRRARARELAVAGMVLLSNDGVLPLPRSTRSVAVIGPHADLLETGGGGSSRVTPLDHRSFVDDLADRLDDATVVAEPGVPSGDALTPVDPRLIAPGLRLETFADPAEAGPVAVDRLTVGSFTSIGPPAPGLPLRLASFRATGVLRPDVSGRWRLGLANAGAARLLVDGHVLVDEADEGEGSFFVGIGRGEVAAEIDLEAGRDHQLVIDLTPERGVPVAGFRLTAARPPSDDPLGAAVEAARQADVAIVVVGGDSRTETEGADRTGLALPAEQDELVSRVAAANPRTVVVVNAGAPVLMPWAAEVAAVVVAWFPGEEGAPALADVVTGRGEPGGRLPVTFPRRIEDTPAHGDGYPGSDGRVPYVEGTLVGHRHVDANGIEPAFCFGHGLGYTTFAYGTEAAAVDGADVIVTVAVSNTGDRRGSEVVQLYARPLDPSGPRSGSQLAATTKVALDPGQSTSVRLVLDRRAFSWWDVEAHAWRVEPGPWELRIGSSSRAIHETLVVEVAAPPAGAT